MRDFRPVKLPLVSEPVTTIIIYFLDLAVNNKIQILSIILVFHSIIVDQSVVMVGVSLVLSVPCVGLDS